MRTEAVEDNKKSSPAATKAKKRVASPAKKQPSPSVATKRAANQEAGPEKPRKVAAGGGDDTWEEF